jgi:hypothetical protein
VPHIPEDLHDPLIERIDAVIARVTFDDSGAMGQGGNGGLLSRETIRAVDELRLITSEIKRLPAAKTED